MPLFNSDIHRICMQHVFAVWDEYVSYCRGRYIDHNLLPAKVKQKLKIMKKRMMPTKMDTSGLENKK